MEVRGEVRSNRIAINWTIYQIPAPFKTLCLYTSRTKNVLSAYLYHKGVE